MQKDEAIREWCVEKAMAIASSDITISKAKASDIIKSAKELEKYVTEG